MRLRQKITSVLVAFSVFAAFSVSAYAQGAAPLPDVPQNELIEEPKEISRTEISDDTLPVYLSADRVKEDGFIARLKEEEQSLSEIILEKEDGTRGLYIFGSDIKYVADDGNIVDKSNKLVGRDTYFTSESNDIDMRLPVLLESGVTLRHDDVFVTMKPKAKLGSRIAAAGTASGDKVVYKDVFGEKTSVEYTLNYDGIKENIILDEYTGVSSFDFEIITGGLALTDNKGSLSLTDEKGKARAVIGDIMVFSADLKNNTFGSYTVTEKVKNEVYIVTVEVDPVYLASPDTAYPVTVDPTLTSVSTTDIMDNLQVYKGADNTGDTAISVRYSTAMKIGWTDNGVGRSLLKLKNFSFADHDLFSSSQLTSAYVELHELTNRSENSPIVCSQFTGNSWGSSTLKTWNQLNASSYGISSEVRGVFYGNGNGSIQRNLSDSEHWYSWNMTSIAKGWIDDSNKFNKGIIFRCFTPAIETPQNASYMRSFSSRFFSNMPFFCFTYTPKYTATVNNYYDNGYNVFYNETVNASVNKIMLYSNSVADRYRSLLGLDITFDKLEYYQSPIDTCKGTVNSSNINTLCEHTNRTNVINSFRLTHVGNNKKSCVFWSCHKITSTNSAGGTNENRSCSTGTSVFILKRPDTDNPRDNCSKSVLMHELNHQFGAQDHYHELDASGKCIHKAVCSECGTNKRPESCIMNSIKLDIANDDIICDTCKNEILFHLSSHHTS